MSLGVAGTEHITPWMYSELGFTSFLPLTSGTAHPSVSEHHDLLCMQEAPGSIHGIFRVGWERPWIEALEYLYESALAILCWIEQCFDSADAAFSVCFSFGRVTILLLSSCPHMIPQHIWKDILWDVSRFICEGQTGAFLLENWSYGGEVIQPMASCDRV